MGRIDSLQGIRSISFLAIFLSHCGIGRGGAIGVSVFLVLSGFLMSYNYSNKEFVCGFKTNLKFAINKVRRLYPLHILMMLPMLLLGLCSTYKKGIQILELAVQFIPKIIANVLIIQAWIPFREYYFSFNGVSWYLSVSVFLYFVYPYIHKLIKKISVWGTIVFLIGIFSLQFAVAVLVSTKIDGEIIYNSVWFTYIFPVFRLGDFMSGCLVGKIFLSVKRKNISSEMASLFEIGAILFMTLSYFANIFEVFPKTVAISVLYLPASVVLVYIFAFDRGIISRYLRIKPIIWLGNLSGYTFLIHQVIINLTESIGLGISYVLVVAFIGSVLLGISYDICYKRIQYQIKEV